MFRWKRRRCCKKCCLVFLVSLVTVIFIGGYKFHAESTCSTEDSKNLVKDLCVLYRKKEVAGSLCSAFCDENKFTYGTCTNYPHGKKVIFMNCDGVCEAGRDVKVVFKTKTDLKDREVMTLPYLPDGTLIANWLESVTKVIKDTIRNHFGLGVSKHKDVLSFLWGYDYKQYIQHFKKQNASVVAIQNIWSLVEQSEYTFMKIFEGYSFAPRIYGTCGPVYFAEYTPTVSDLDNGLFPDMLSATWEDRAQIAISILELLKVVDNELHQPLHLCDVKGSNFGINHKGQVTLIDTDCAVFQENLETSIFSDPCEKHADCNFFDCHGYCDVKNKKCLKIRVNNNLQAVCEDVFLGHFANFITGLLRNPPSNIQKELFRILYDCAYPGVGKGSRHSRAPASPEIQEELERILRWSLKGLKVHVDAV